MSATTKYAAMSRRAAMTAAALAAMATWPAAAGAAPAPPPRATWPWAPPKAPRSPWWNTPRSPAPTARACKKTTWPAFKANYVDTNKVRYVFRELPTPAGQRRRRRLHDRPLRRQDKYFDVVHGIMASQAEWRAGVNPRDTLFRVGNGAGLSNQQIETCIKDPDDLKAVRGPHRRPAIKAGVNGTPAFFVNGVQVITPGCESGPSMADLSKAIDAELAKS